MALVALLVMSNMSILINPGCSFVKGHGDDSLLGIKRGKSSEKLSKYMKIMFFESDLLESVANH